jgi:hypothetical protein
MAFPDTVRPITVEILINQVWIDITQYVLQRQASSVSRGEGGEDNSMPPTTMSLLLRNDDGRFAQDNPMSPYWPYLKQACQVRFKLTHGGVTYTRAWLETAEAPVVVEAAPENNVVQMDCGGYFRRWERSRTLESPMRRTIRVGANLVAYWPMEDAGERTQTLASAIPNRPDMNIKAAISVASYSGFSGSMPVPDIGDGQVTGLVQRYSPVGNQSAVWAGKGPVSVTDTTIMTLLMSGGTIYRIAVLASTAGDLRLRFYDRFGAILSTSSYVGTHNINDRDMLLRVMVANSGSNTNWFLASVDQADVSTTFSSSGSVASEQVGSISSITFGYFNNYGNPAGHAAIYNGTPANLTDVVEAFGAYRGETTGERFRRTCRDNNISHRIIGDPNTLMGPQPIGTIKDILQDAADAEHAFIIESRDDFGLTMIGLEALWGQRDEARIAPDIPVTAAGTSSTVIVSSDYSPWFWAGVEFQVRTASTDALVTSQVFTVTDKYTSGSDIVVTFTPTIGTTPTTTHIVTTLRSGRLALDLAAKEVGFPFKPVKDDRLVANRVTVSSREGASSTATLDVGSRSTQDPPEGIGLYEVSETLNLYSDGQTAEHASYLLGLGTTEDARFPDLDIPLHRRNLASRQAELLAADVGELITIDHASGAYMYDQVRQIGRGYQETFDGNKWHTISWNTVPARPYDVLKFDANPKLIGQGTSLTTGYLIALETPAREVKDGDRAWLRNSTGAVKQNTLFTVTVGVTASGFTNINLSPNANAVTVAGDILEIVREDSRYGANSTVLAQSLTTSTTGAVSVSVGADVWTTDPSDFPLDVKVGGERITLSSISGGSGSISFIGTGSSSQADNAGSVAAGLPTGAANGHVVLLYAAIRDDAATVNQPTNWTTIHSAGTNMKLFARVYNGVWTMPTVTFSGGGTGDTTITMSAAYSGITITSAVTNTPASGTGDDILVSTNNMGSVAGQYGLRLACGVKFDDWTTVVTPSGLDEVTSFSSTLGNDMSVSWAHAIDTSSGNYPGATGRFTTTGGAAAFYESFVVFFPSAPQMFTILTRSVNGVVKAHSVGAQVEIADKAYYGLG